MISIEAIVTAVACVFLVKVNRNNAYDRNKSTAAITAITICMVVGLEITGWVVSFACGIFDVGVYLIGFSLGAIGGVISWFIARSGPIIDRTPSSLHMTARYDASTANNQTYYKDVNDEIDEFDGTVDVSSCFKSAASAGINLGIVCPGCGRANEAGTTFCFACGARIAD